MQLLVIGGSGRVGTIVLPHLAEHHRIRVLDLVPPPPGPWDYVPGKVLHWAPTRPASPVR